MGNEIFGVDLAGTLADALGDGLPDVTITREALGDRDPDDLTGGPVAGDPLTFSAKGFWEDFTGLPPPGVTIELDDRKLVIIGDTADNGCLPLRRNDAVTVHEDVGDLTLYVVGPIRRDPAAAVFEYQCRDRRGPDGV